MRCDVLVVGASPAGIMAALASARYGADVILMDKTLGDMNHIANTIFQGMALRSGLHINNSYITNELEGMRIISPGGFGLTIPAHGYFIDRRKFDDYYIEMARAAGVALLRQEVLDLKQEGSHRSVVTDQEEINAHIVIDASGIQPALAQKAGLSPMRHPTDIAWAIEALVEHPRFHEEHYFEYFVGSIAPGWKATFSPAGNDRATLGVFVRGHGPNIYPFFKNFINYFKNFKSRSLEDIERIKIVSKVCGGDPIAVLPGKIVSEGFMVTGGAAGQSGLAYGMRAGTICGQVAGEALKSMNFSRRYLQRYEKRWGFEFYWEYRLGRAALETLKDMSDMELDGLIKNLSGKKLALEGSLIEKSSYAGAKVAKENPKVIFDLIRNLIRA